MNQNEIIAMAKEAGLNSYRIAPGEAVAVWERFADLVAEKAEARANERANASWRLMCEKMVAAEREAWRASLEPAFRGRMGSEQVREIVQSAIRARGQKEGV